MNDVRFQEVLILGAGVMGHGIALVCARGGSRVFVCDINEDALKAAQAKIESKLRLLEKLGGLKESAEAISKRIIYTRDYKSSAAPAYIIEAIVENIEAKKKLFESLADFYGNSAIVSSNTSYIDIFKHIPDSIQENVLGAHFFVPPYIVPLIEIAAGPKTNPENIKRIEAYYEACNMKPIVMKKFCPGFIVNKLQRAYNLAMYELISGGYADPQEIDRAVKASLGIRIPVIGIAQKCDLAGLDTVLKILESNRPEGLEIPKLLVDLVGRGYFGVKTSKGFYDYGGRCPEEIEEDLDIRMLRVRKCLENIGEL